MTVKIVFAGKHPIFNVNSLKFKGNNHTLNMLMDADETQPYPGIVLGEKDVEHLIEWLKKAIKE